MKPTIRDVAKAAGVSAMSVSNVLHGTGSNVRVSEVTSEKIREVARRLQYQPNNLARNLRSGKTRMIGVVFQHLLGFSPDNAYYPQLLNGIMAPLFAANYTLALCPKLVQNGDIGAMLDGRFDGVLWARPDFTEANIETLRDARVPLVMMHAPPGSADGIATYCADNIGAMNLVAEHLSGLGHQSCTFVVNDVDSLTAEGKARTEALKRAAALNGLRSEVFVWNEELETFEAYYKSRTDVTALVCFSDTLAGRLLSVCQNLEIKVPHDVSVVGFDSSSFCDLTQPRLTSVFQPVEKIANDAVTHLLKLIAAEPEEVAVLNQSSTLYPCGLDVRDSTCPPSPQKTTHEI